MDKKTQRSMISGLLLILLGAAFLAYQFMPQWFGWLKIEMTWPWIVIGVGLALFVFGLLVDAPGMAIPACIVTGIGSLLYYQNTTGDWESWSYAWTLIPGFVGIGIILSGLLGGGKLREELEGGGVLLLISLILFGIFGSFLGGQRLLGNYWPVLIILAGLIVLMRSLFPRR